MSDINSVMVQLDQFRRGDQSAAAEIYFRFEKRLIALAQKKLGDVPKRAADEKDIVNSACDSFFRAVQANKFDKLADKDDLWKLLSTITVRKCWDHIECELRTRRKNKVGEEPQNQDGEKKNENVVTGRVIGESTLGHPAGAVRVMEQVLDREPTAHEVAVFMDLLAMLPADLQQIAQWKLELLSNREIAERLDRIPKWVDRQVDRIRKIWIESGVNVPKPHPSANGKQQSK